MTLLAPWALWFSALAGAVVALYLLKIKRRQATVPALDFWLALAGRTKVHSLFDRLKRLLSMLLWLAVVACLVLALGNPIFSLGRVKPRAIAVILDNAASMQTLEADLQGLPRLELARQAVERLTTGRPVSEEWLLIEAAREPRVLQPWTYDGKSIRRAAAAAEPFDGSGDLAGAVALAGQLLQGKPDPCIVVVSDGGGGALEPIAKADPRIVHWPIGRTSDNLGISRLAVRADRQNGNYLALISLVNASDQKIDTQVTLEIDSAAHSVELVSVEPGATWEKTVIIDPPAEGSAGGVLRASIDRPDALPADNEAYAILQPIRPAVVWLVTPSDAGFFFEQALAAMAPLVWAEESITLSLDQYNRVAAAVGGTGPSPVKPPDLVIFNNCTPDALPAKGRFILINSWPAQIPASVAGPLEAPQLYLAPRPHALMQNITLQGARLAKASRITLRQPGRVLAHTAEGDPLVFLFEDPDRVALCLAFDVLDSDLPFRNAFPLLLRNAVAFMHEEAPSWLAPQFRIGEPVRPQRPLPDGLAQVTLGVLRDGKTEERTLPVTARSFAFTDTGRPGALRLGIGDERAYAAVNLTDAAESRIGPLAAPVDPAETLHLSGRLLGSLPWISLTALAAIIITLEWLTYHFRWTE